MKSLSSLFVRPGDCTSFSTALELNEANSSYAVYRAQAAAAHPLARVQHCAISAASMCDPSETVGYSARGSRGLPIRAAADALRLPPQRKRKLAGIVNAIELQIEYADNGSS